jgi:hypothetical protein
MFYSGALTAEQTDAMYISGLGLTTCEIGRWLTVGSPSGGGDGHALIFVHIPQVPDPRWARALMHDEVLLAPGLAVWVARA